MIETAAFSSILGVLFRPGGARQFFGRSDQFLMSRSHLATCGGKAAVNLRDRLGAEPTAEGMLRTIEAELLRRLGYDGSETGWLIEWPADRHGPTRYYSVGEPPVIDANNATRFARKEDAEAVLRRGELKGATKHGAKVCEHMWMPLLKREEAAA